MLFATVFTSLLAAGVALAQDYTINTPVSRSIESAVVGREKKKWKTILTFFPFFSTSIPYTTRLLLALLYAIMIPIDSQLAGRFDPVS
jgi:hypothetical protein